MFLKMAENRSLSNLYSKKLIATETTIGAIIYLSKDAPDKFYYCCLIVLVAIVYKICDIICKKA